MRKQLKIGLGMCSLAAIMVGVGLAGGLFLRNGGVHLKTNADELKSTIVTPHLEQEIVPGSSVLWCNTFQLAWNELCDQTGGTVEMAAAPAMVSVLNKKTADRSDLDPDSYVAMAGLASDGIYDKIRKELDRKFKGQACPELLNSTPEMLGVAYAYLSKELPFQWAFTRFHGRFVFEGEQVDAFGIGQFLKIQKDEVRMASQVAVLDHRNNDDLIIELATQSKDDRLILAKVPPQKSLGETIAMVENRIAGAKPMPMHEAEDLVVPVLDFDVLKEYPELCNHPIVAAGKKFDGKSLASAKQSIRFRLDEKGAVLRSETVVAACMPERMLVFNKPFLILLSRREAKHPYFALWVGNAELLYSSRKKPREKRAIHLPAIQ
jgi:hypothetical protein